jgi:hypothetical protein
LQTFFCPQCGHRGTFDPWVESAKCANCGHTPPKPGQRRAEPAWEPATNHEPFLAELTWYWQRTHEPDPSFTLHSSAGALEFFEDYQRALGEQPGARPGSSAGFARNHHPGPYEIPAFASAYLLLKRGDRARAADYLRGLTADFPEFADAWVWLTATTDDPFERLDYLRTAVAQEPAHPLARDALAIVRGKVPPTAGPREEAAAAACPQCGGGLRYQPAARAVECAYCGHPLELRGTNLLEQDAALVSDMRLRRRHQAQTWGELACIVRCASCGARLTTTRLLAQQCPFCGSNSALTEANHSRFERPDGFLPFTIDELQAAAAVQSARRTGLRGLWTRIAGSDDELREIRGLYLPFWVLDAFVEERTWLSAGLGEISSEETPPAVHLTMYDNLLFSAVAVPPRNLLDQILPFEVHALVPYEARLLADWPAALYQRDIEAAVQEAFGMVVGLARQRAEGASDEESPGYRRVRRSYHVTSMTYQLLLLPVYVALLQSDRARRIVLVNGQTGKVAVGRCRSPFSA